MVSFITKNESFTCQHCGETNPPARGTCRNHCRECFFSLHVDKNTPGDRLSNCKSLMPPIKVDQNGKKGWIIYHKCLKCGKIIKNKLAEDDNFENFILLTQQLEQSGSKKTGK